MNENINFEYHNKKMYVTVDLISGKLSPIAHFENDSQAYRDFTASFEMSKKSNPNLEDSDFQIVYIGTIRNDGVITPDYRLVTKESISDIQKIRDAFVEKMKANSELHKTPRG